MGEENHIEEVHAPEIKKKMLTLFTLRKNVERSLKYRVFAHFLNRITKREKNSYRRKEKDKHYNYFLPLIRMHVTESQLNTKFLTESFKVSFSAIRNEFFWKEMHFKEIDLESLRNDIVLANLNKKRMLKEQEEYIQEVNTYNVTLYGFVDYDEMSNEYLYQNELMPFLSNRRSVMGEGGN